MKKMIALLAAAVLALSLFTGCQPGKDKFISELDAQAIALEAAGLEADSVTDIHSHSSVDNGSAVYSIHFDYDGVTHEYVIDARSGEILSSGK